MNKRLMAQREKRKEKTKVKVEKGEELVVTHKYKCRAEFVTDIAKLLLSETFLSHTDGDFQITISVEPFRDYDFTFTSEQTLQQVREEMIKVEKINEEEFDVMIETVNYRLQYTGEKYYFRE
jgi:hypothetical protein